MLNSGFSKKRSKYGNKMVNVNGRDFHSKKEAQRYIELSAMQDANEIEGLQCQVTFKLDVNGVHVCSYKPDFVYWQNGRRVVEDVKSAITKKNPVYRIKNKLMKEKQQ